MLEWTFDRQKADAVFQRLVLAGVRRLPVEASELAERDRVRVLAVNDIQNGLIAVVKR